MNSENLYSDQSLELQAPTAGIIIIGDEILKGQVQDTNTFFFAKHLYSFGIKVKKISVIPDDIDCISSEVALFSKLFTYVLTSGGIGPTHDDITLEGVAKAFGERLKPHPLLVSFISEWFKTNDMASPAMKMAFIPESADLIFGEDKETGFKSRFPVIQLKNVTVFPGIPHLLETSFKLVAKGLFHKPGQGFYSYVLYLNCDEVSVASLLREAVEKFQSTSFGSYPKIFHSYYRTRITIESRLKKDADDALNYLSEHLDKNYIVDYNPDPFSSAWDHIVKLSSFSSEEFNSLLNHAASIIEKCFNMYRYNLDCEIVNGSLKTAFSVLLKRKPNVKAVIMGTRKSDPYSEKLDHFSPTDNGWPYVMRVNPILNWTYSDVWHFLRGIYLPYCSLYDRGYTSIGNQENTIPNPSLQTVNQIGQVIYSPAYLLSDPELERRGRIKSKQ